LLFFLKKYYIPLFPFLYLNAPFVSDGTLINNSLIIPCRFGVTQLNIIIIIIVKYRASHIRLISEFILYATKNTNDADHLIPFIM
jgi:hypothetical protein